MTHIKLGEKDVMLVDVEGHTFKFEEEIIYDLHHRASINMKMFIDKNTKSFVEGTVRTASSLNQRTEQLYKDIDYRIYQCYSWIIYEKNDQFYLIPQNYQLLNTKKIEQEDFINVVHILRKQFGWKYMLNFGYNMIKLNDTVFISDYKRLANREITATELGIEPSEYDYEIQEAQNILDEFGIKW
jgi:hypothetical protein